MPAQENHPKDEEIAQLRAELALCKQESAGLKTALFAALAIAGILLVTVILMFMELKKRPNPKASTHAKADISPLFNLLRGMFNVDEIKMFVHLQLGDEGYEVVRSISTDKPLDVVVYSIVIALQNRGLIDKRLFIALEAVRPNLRAEIRKIEKTCKKLKPAA